MPKEKTALESALDRLHDGHLVGVRVENRLVTLECRRVDRAAITIVISDVDDMYCTNLRNGNIILEALVLPRIDDVIELSVELVQGLCQSQSPARGAQYVERMRLAEQKHAMTYFVLGSSYGADLVVASSGDVSSIRIEAAS